MSHEQRRSRGAFCVKALFPILAAGSFVAACARRYSIESALRTNLQGPCPNPNVVDTGNKDCDGLPMYALYCDGKFNHAEAIRCYKGDCFAEQIAGRCYK
jgi:hypothetical protein